MRNSQLGIRIRASERGFSSDVFFCDGRQTAFERRNGIRGLRAAFSRHNGVFGVGNNV